MTSTYTKALIKRIQEAKEKYGDYLYHYTSIDALMGILEKKEFWLGNTANMNDSSELIDFTKRIIDAVMEKLRTFGIISAIKSDASDIIYNINVLIFCIFRGFNPFFDFFEKNLIMQNQKRRD